MKITSIILSERNQLLNNEKKIKKTYTKKILLQIILFLFSYLLYFLSLEKCLEGFDVCCFKNKYIKTKLFQLVISSIITAILIELMFYNYIYKLNLIHFIIVFFFFFSI